MPNETSYSSLKIYHWSNVEKWSELFFLKYSEITNPILLIFENGMAIVILNSRFKFCLASSYPLCLNKQKATNYQKFLLQDNLPVCSNNNNELYFVACLV